MRLPQLVALLMALPMTAHVVPRPVWHHMEAHVVRQPAAHHMEALHGLVAYWVAPEIALMALIMALMAPLMAQLMGLQMALLMALQMALLAILQVTLVALVVMLTILICSDSFSMLWKAQSRRRSHRIQATCSLRDSCM